MVPAPRPTLNADVEEINLDIPGHPTAAAAPQELTQEQKATNKKRERLHRTFMTVVYHVFALYSTGLAVITFLGMVSSHKHGRGGGRVRGVGSIPHVLVRHVTPLFSTLHSTPQGEQGEQGHWCLLCLLPRLQGDAIADDRRPVDDKHIGSRGLSVLQWSIAAIWGLPLLLCCCVSWTSGFIYVKCVPWVPSRSPAPQFLLCPGRHLAISTAPLTTQPQTYTGCEHPPSLSPSHLAPVQ